MSSTPVTIVVPTYNAESTLAETLQSLLNQDYAALEILVVDDGSKDRSGEIAKGFVSARLRYIRQENAGQATALNNGWLQASGRYIGYLSADDIMYPTAISELVKFLNERNDVVAVYPDYDLISADSKKIRLVEAPNFEVKDLVEQSICQPGPGALFRKDAFDKTGGWNPQLRLTPDFDFWMRLSRFGQLARYPKSLAGFRVHEESQSFAVPSEAKSEEPPQVVEAFLAQGGEWNRGRALAWAHLLSTRLHLRAGRWGRAASHLRTALRADVSTVSHRRFWSLMLSGAFGRLRYQIQHSTQRQRKP